MARHRGWAVAVHNQYCPGLHVPSISTGCYVRTPKLVLGGGEGSLWKPATEKVRCRLCRKQLWQVSEATQVMGAARNSGFWARRMQGWGERRPGLAGLGELCLTSSWRQWETLKIIKQWNFFKKCLKQVECYNFALGEVGLGVIQLEREHRKKCSVFGHVSLRCKLSMWCPEWSWTDSLLFSHIMQFWKFSPNEICERPTSICLENSKGEVLRHLCLWCNCKFFSFLSRLNTELTSLSLISSLLRPKICPFGSD